MIDWLRKMSEGRPIGVKDVRFVISLYSDWELILSQSYTFEDEQPGSPLRTHPVKKLVARKPANKPLFLGMSIIQPLKRAGNMLTVKGFDMLDDTALIDIKPYIPKFEI